MPALRQSRRISVALLFVSSLARAQSAATPPAKSHGKPFTATTAVIDTTFGRITCQLYTKQAPVATANFIGLANGTEDWTDPVTGQPQHGKRFYDGIPFTASPGHAIINGDRLMNGKGTAGFTFAGEFAQGLEFDRPGRLALSGSPGQNSSAFVITLHSDRNNNGKRPIIGQCTPKSVEIAAAIAHTLLAAENHPAKSIVINRVSIVRRGQLPPPVARPVAPVLTSVSVPPAVPAPPAPEPTGPTVVLDTMLGRITCRLFSELAPITTESFLGLIRGTKDWTDPATKEVVSGKPFYDGLTFHRVIPDFMIQGGDRLGTGEGDGGFKLKNEVAPGLTFDRPGRLAMANAGPDTGSTQFFVTENPLHRLDGRFTIFGQCDDASVKVVAAIARVPRNDDDNPETPVVIRKATVLPE